MRAAGPASAGPLRRETTDPARRCGTRQTHGLARPARAGVCQEEGASAVPGAGSASPWKGRRGRGGGCPDQRARSGIRRARSALAKALRRRAMSRGVRSGNLKGGRRFMGEEAKRPELDERARGRPPAGAAGALAGAGCGGGVLQAAPGRREGRERRPVRLAKRSSARGFPLLREPEPSERTCLGGPRRREPRPDTAEPGVA